MLPVVQPQEEQSKQGKAGNSSYNSANNCSGIGAAAGARSVHDWSFSWRGSRDGCN